MKQSHTVRVETPQDVAGLEHLYAQCSKGAEAWEFIQSLRDNATVWMPQLSIIAEDVEGSVSAHAVAVRCWIDSFPALVIASVVGARESALPAVQHLVEKAREDAQLSASPLCLLVHASTDFEPDFYEALGFEQARFEGIKTTLDVPRHHFLALNLNTDFELAPGTAIFSPEFGVEDDDDF